MENWEVNDVYNWTATQHFPDWCLCMWSEQSLICGEGSDSQPGVMLITWILTSRYSLRRTSKHRCVVKKIYCSFTYVAIIYRSVILFLQKYLKYAVFVLIEAHLDGNFYQQWLSLNADKRRCDNSRCLWLYSRNDYNHVCTFLLRKHLFNIPCVSDTLLWKSERPVLDLFIAWLLTTFDYDSFSNWDFVFSYSSISSKM